MPSREKVACEMPPGCAALLRAISDNKGWIAENAAPAAALEEALSRGLVREDGPHGLGYAITHRGEAWVRSR